jgi:hypothetical protein
VRRGSHCGGGRCAPTSLRCSRRGSAAELAAFALLSTLKQLRRACQRSTLRVPPPALRFSPPQRSPRPTAPAAKQEELVHKRWNTHQPAKACVRFAWRASMALSSARGRVGARSALRHLTHRRCLSGSGAQRNGSEFRRCDRPLSTAKAVAAGGRHREAPGEAHTGLRSEQHGATFSVVPPGSTV